MGEFSQLAPPTTAAFRSEGRLTRKGGRWQVEVDTATIGRSQLNGSFLFDGERPTPLLSGQLRGERLDLIDLGPAFGAATEAVSKPSKSKVLPTRPYDLASLRAMDADVRVDIAELNLHTSLLEPLRPLRGHLVLAGGVLTLSELDARTADANDAARATRTLGYRYTVPARATQTARNRAAVHTLSRRGVVG